MLYSAVVLQVIMDSQLSSSQSTVYCGEVSLFDKSVISMGFFDYRDVLKLPKPLCYEVDNIVRKFFKEITSKSVAGSELIIKPMVTTYKGVLDACAIVGEYHERFSHDIDVEHMNIADYDRFQEYMNINLLKDYNIDSPNFAKLIAKNPNVHSIS